MGVGVGVVKRGRREREMGKKQGERGSQVVVGCGAVRGQKYRSSVTFRDAQLPVLLLF